MIRYFEIINIKDCYDDDLVKIDTEKDIKLLDTIQKIRYPYYVREISKEFYEFKHNRYVRPQRG